MSVSSVDSSSSQSIGNLLLQQLLAEGTSSQSSSSLSSLLDDLVSISSTGKQLSQAPEAVTKAMSDLLSSQKDVEGDLTQLKNYFKQNPERLASVLSTLQSGTITYSASGLLNSSSDKSALLSALLGAQSQGSLFSFLGDSGSGASNSTLSLLG
ncbi:MAG: hypothetical protein H6Q00_1028 [Holophagaceae bacterium]|nr:hypothetical protein [Holophagaceae bacterium]